MPWPTVTLLLKLAAWRSDVGTWLEKFGAITVLCPFHPKRTESTFFEVGEECGCGEKKHQNLIR